MEWPAQDAALAWLVGQGIAAHEATRLLQASGDRPDDALDAANGGLPAQAWSEFPAAMLAGNANFVRDWSAALLLDSLHKLCHDTMVRLAGAQPRFFDNEALKSLPPVNWIALSHWAQNLKLARKSVDHPFNLGLMQETLVEQARSALNSSRH